MIAQAVTIAPLLLVVAHAVEMYLQVQSHVWASPHHCFRAAREHMYCLLRCQPWKQLARAVVL